jgi:signal transduction histidine kinase
MPNSSRSNDVSAFPWISIWMILSYGLLVIALGICLLDPTLGPLQKAAASAGAVIWGGWYELFSHRMARQPARERILGISFIVVIALTLGMSWIHPAFLMLAFGFYGITFGVLPLRWAIPLVILLSFGLGWRFIGFSGTLNWNNLPTLSSFLLSAFFSTLLGVYIQSIIQRSQERQQMIEQLQATRSELAQAERQAGMLEERQRLAGEIHDTLAQGFTSVVMHLEAADPLLESDLPGARKHIAQARQTARESLSTARRVLWALRPDVVQHELLDQALERVARRWSSENGLAVTTEVSGVPQPLPAAIQATFLRTAQEALANVLKHAHANRVNLTLTYMEDEVILDVQDDGQGFDPTLLAPQAELEHGYGLIALQERAAQLGGSLQIESAPGEGTTLVLALPIK